MKIIFLLLFIMISTRCLFSQQIVTTAGSTLANSSGIVTYTLGEPVSQTLVGVSYSQNLSSDTIILTQGFNQPVITTSIIKVNEGLDFPIVIYPNPAVSFLKLSIDKEDVSGLSFNIYDMSGKLIYRQNIEYKITDVPIKSMIKGSYLLEVENRDKVLIVFKVIKQ